MKTQLGIVGVALLLVLFGGAIGKWSAEYDFQHREILSICVPIFESPQYLECITSSPEKIHPLREKLRLQGLMTEDS